MEKSAFYYIFSPRRLNKTAIKCPKFIGQFVMGPPRKILGKLKFLIHFPTKSGVENVLFRAKLSPLFSHVRMLKMVQLIIIIKSFVLVRETNKTAK